jgi:hypothetical protein
VWARRSGKWRARTEADVFPHLLAEAVARGPGDGTHGSSDRELAEEAESLEREVQIGDARSPSVGIRATPPRS